MGPGQCGRGDAAIRSSHPWRGLTTGDAVLDRSSQAGWGLPTGVRDAVIRSSAALVCPTTVAGGVERLLEFVPSPGKHGPHSSGFTDALLSWVRSAGSLLGKFTSRLDGVTSTIPSPQSRSAAKDMLPLPPIEPNWTATHREYSRPALSWLYLTVLGLNINYGGGSRFPAEPASAAQQPSLDQLYDHISFY